MYICAYCIRETYLSDKVRRSETEHKCRYCGECEKAITLEEMANEIATAFETHYIRTAQEPELYQSMMMRDKESNYEWEREGRRTIYAIMDAAEIPEKAATDLQKILKNRYFDLDAASDEECEFASDAYYEEIMPDGHEWDNSWQAFEKTLKFESRFFSRTATQQLNDLFATIEDIKTRDGKSVIVDAGPRTKLDHLFRARVFQSDEQLLPALKRPDQELAPPPSRVASAGRMNAHGISVFYGAADANIALAEVRPPVGAQVMVARFDIVRPLKLLDLTALPDLKEDGSIFDPEYALRLGRMKFLGSLAQRMSRPVMPNDQLLDYLPTQAIADFLATESKVPLDGIIFPSAQANGSGLNVVLFHKSSRVGKLPLQKGTKIFARSYSTDADGYHRDYIVYEQVPSPEPEQGHTDTAQSFFMPTSDWMDIDDDSREMTLKIDLKTISVHVIKSVAIDTDNYEVKRIETDTSF